MNSSLPSQNSPIHAALFLRDHFVYVISVVDIMGKHRKVNIKSKVADQKLPPIKKVAYKLQHSIGELELTSEPVTDSIDSDTDTVIWVADIDSDTDTVILGAGAGDIGNLEDFHDDQ